MLTIHCYRDRRHICRQHVDEAFSHLSEMHATVSRSAGQFTVHPSSVNSEFSDAQVHTAVNAWAKFTAVHTVKSAGVLQQLEHTITPSK